MSQDILKASRPSCSRDCPGNERPTLAIDLEKEKRVREYARIVASGGELFQDKEEQGEDND